MRTTWPDKPGGVFVLKESHLSEDDRLLLQAAARVVLIGDRGLLDSQLDRIERLSEPARSPGTLARAEPVARLRAGCRRPGRWRSTTAWAGLPRRAGSIA